MKRGNWGVENPFISGRLCSLGSAFTQVTHLLHGLCTAYGLLTQLQQQHFASFHLWIKQSLSLILAWGLVVRLAEKASSLFCLKKKKISTESQYALLCIQSTPFKVCRISHGLLQLISSMLPWDIAARRKHLISCCFIIMHVLIHPSHLSPAFPLLSTSLLVRSKSTREWRRFQLKGGMSGL